MSFAYLLCSANCSQLYPVVLFVFLKWNFRIAWKTVCYSTRTRGWKGDSGGRGITSTSVLGHFGPWSLQTFKKDRSDKGLKCLNHFGTWDHLSIKRDHWRSAPSMTTAGAREP